MKKYFLFLLVLLFVNPPVLLSASLLTHQIRQVNHIIQFLKDFPLPDSDSRIILGVEECSGVGKVYCQYIVRSAHFSSERTETWAHLIYFSYGKECDVESKNVGCYDDFSSFDGPRKIKIGYLSSNQFSVKESRQEELNELRNQYDKGWLNYRDDLTQFENLAAAYRRILWEHHGHGFLKQVVRQVHSSLHVKRLAMYTQKDAYSIFNPQTRSPVEVPAENCEFLFYSGTAKGQNFTDTISKCEVVKK